MIVRPYIRPGNMVVYSPPKRADIEISVRIERVDRLLGVWISYADGTRALVAPESLHPMPAERMQPVASIVQLEDVIAEYEAMDGDVSAADRLKRKHGVR